MARGRAAPASLPLGFRYAKLNAYAAARGISATSRYPRGNGFAGSCGNGLTRSCYTASLTLSVRASLIYATRAASALWRRLRRPGSMSFTYSHSMASLNPAHSFANPCNAGCERSRAAGFIYSRGSGFALQNATFMTITMGTTAADAARISSRLWTIRRPAVSGISSGLPLAAPALAQQMLPEIPQLGGKPGLQRCRPGISSGFPLVTPRLCLL